MRRLMTVLLPAVLFLGLSGILTSCERKIPEIVDFSLEDSHYEGTFPTEPPESGTSREDSETEGMSIAHLIGSEEEEKRNESISREEESMRTEGTDISNGEQPKLPTALPTHPEPRYQTEESSTEASGDPEGTDGNEGAENAEENAGGETPGEASVSEPAAETLPEPASETLPESASEPAAETLTSPASENPSETSEAQPSDGSSGYPFPTRSLQELTAQKAVFLTFDDGPSEEVTPYILDILDQYGIKACFFITYQPHLENLYREIVNRGHTIGIHTACHRYEQIYSSFENWYNDFMTAFNYVIQVTGFTPNVYRFPGGSNQTHSTPEVKAQIIEYLHSHGIEYFDWNVSTEDAVGDKTPEQALEMAMSEFTYRTLPVILMHDGQDQSDTMTMLPALITKIQSMGYTFLPLDATVPPVQQGINWDY